MIDDILYKLLRKALPLRLYRAISRSAFGRTKNYHQAPTYIRIYEHYRSENLAFAGGTVLEIGPGAQFFTALCFLADGARQVLLVDPKITLDSFAGDLAAFNKATGSELGPEARGRVSCYRDIRDIPREHGEAVKLICSHQVLEHVADLPSFFAHSRRLLAVDGISYHLVDLSDHTYHIFHKFKVTRSWNHNRALYHLRYSKRMFDFLNDGKTYMNRILLPTYLELAAQNGLAVRSLRVFEYGRIPVHADLLPESGDPEKIFVSGFSLKLGLAGPAA